MNKTCFNCKHCYKGHICTLFDELVEEKEYYQIKSGKCEEELLQLRRDNEQLKKQIGNLEHTRDFADEVCADCERLEHENEQLKVYVGEMEDYLGRLEEKIERLEEKNEQLKNKIDALEDDNETYHKSLEKLNLYTKRFIPTNCINEFKDCKTNRYYWLDHEGNFEGCLELLNLLDCERELLESENRQLKGRLMVYEEQIKGDFE